MNRKQIIQSFKDSFGSDLDYIKFVRENGKTTTRCAFNDWLDYLNKDGEITDKQRQYTVPSEKELFNFNIQL